MSTLLEQHPQVPLKSEDDLAGYFQKFCKSHDEVRVGLEAEFLTVDRATGKALPFHGPISVHTMMKALAEQNAYEPFYENGNIIALKKAVTFITLEPGGQMELSAPPVKNIFEVEAQVEHFLEELRCLHRPNHNLDRCRTQLKLVECIEAQEDTMNAFVRKVRKGKR